MGGQLSRNDWLIRVRRGRLYAIPTHRRAAFCRSLLTDHLSAVRVHPAVHGFVKGRSRETAVAPHRGRKYVMHLDLCDFFAHCYREKVRHGWTLAALYPGILAAVEHWCFFLGGLARGACTSPVLSNLAATELDRNLNWLGYAYTRYADNLILSGDTPPDEGLVRGLIRQCGFRV